MKPVFIRPDSTEADRRATCYVCGCPRCAEYPLAIRQQASGPYFPFLETHEPPEGAEPPSQDGRILSCFLCYSYLTQQWEVYEREKVPPVKRIYWLKRIDNGPYTGVEVGVQSEYASQLLGLTTDPPVPPDVKRPGPAASSSARAHPPPPTVPPPAAPVAENKRARILPPQAQPPTMPLPPPGVPPIPLGLQLPQSGPQQEALDLSLDCRRGTKRPPPPPQTESLDLSMPDKNATTEVCYVCGDQHQKGSLDYIYAKQLAGGPFFPSLMLHSRPSKSHPMEASGRVQSCRECYNHLHHQWEAYEVHKIPHAERNYTLRKRNAISAHDSTAFICYKCGLEFASSKLCLIYCKPNTEKEPYYPFIEGLTPPEGASPISPQGMVQVCSLCFKSIPQEQKRRRQEIANDADKNRSPEIKNTNAEGANSGHLPISAPAVSTTQHNSQLVVSESGVEDVACYLCHYTHHRQKMHWLSMVADKSTTNGMYFLFLKFLPRMSSNTVIEDGKVLACRLCYQHLSMQWEEYEKENVPSEHRQFSLRTMPITSHSPRLTPGSRHGSPDRMINADGSSPPQGFTGTEDGQSKLTENIPTKISESTGYMGQPLHTLEVVPATQDSSAPTLPVITTQRALNIAINCFVCSFHSKVGQTYPLRSKTHGTEPFFPFLAKHQSAHPEARVDASCVLVCLCCFHSLILQWQRYEKAQVDHNARLYDTYNYSCYICSLKTYRKRLYLLPVKDYPFLKDHNRPPGGMVVDNGHSVVVCKDCYSSLKNQYLELERWGVPVERRQYNWIQRPPPPEFQQQLPTTGSSKPSSSSSQGTTLPVVVAGAGASSPGLHPGMPSETLSQSPVTGRAPTSPRSPQGSVAKSSSAPGNARATLSSAVKPCEEAALDASSTIPKITSVVGSPVILSEYPNVGTIPSCFAPLQLKIGIARQGGNTYDDHLTQRHSVASREGNNTGDASSNGFSGNSSFTAMDQSTKTFHPKRKFLPAISRGHLSPIKASDNNIQLLDKEKHVSSKASGLIATGPYPSPSSSPQIPQSPCSPHLVSPSHELQAKCS